MDGARDNRLIDGQTKLYISRQWIACRVAKPERAESSRWVIDQRDTKEPLTVQLFCWALFTHCRLQVRVSRTPATQEAGWMIPFEVPPDVAEQAVERILERTAEQVVHGHLPVMTGSPLEPGQVALWQRGVERIVQAVRQEIDGCTSQ